MATDVRADRKYTKDHEWALSESGKDPEAAQLTSGRRRSRRSFGHIRRRRQFLRARRRNLAMRLTGRAENRFPGQRFLNLQSFSTTGTLNLYRHEMAPRRFKSSDGSLLQNHIGIFRSLPVR